MDARSTAASRPWGDPREPERRLAPGLALGLALATLVLSLGARAGAEEATIDDATIRAARRILPSVVRIQWRSKGERPVVVERHALVVDPDGWLLLAGPPPPDHGTLAATLGDDRSMSARVWASDPGSGLTLLRLPVSGLPAAAIYDLDEAGEGGMVPPRLRPGTKLAMVTAEGALARGTLRGSHRTRILGPAGADATQHEITCLDEAALNVVPTDLGAPWIDDQGRVLGLLVGADVTVPSLEGADALSPRPEVVAAYAVPSPVLRAVWPLLRDRRRVPRAALGIWTKPLSDILQRHVCRDCGGRVVTDVMQGRAAEHAGLRTNDIIRKVGGHPFAPGVELRDVLLRYRPGNRVTLGVLRAGEELTIEAVLETAD